VSQLVAACRGINTSKREHVGYTLSYI